MRYIKLIPIVLFVFTLTTKINASSIINKEHKTAESVLVFANNMEAFDAKALQSEMEGLSVIEKAKLVKMSIKEAKEASASSKAAGGLYVLAILMPPVAVGIYTGWDKRTLYNFLWTCLGVVPGMVHALMVLSK